jgi:hypothetical protein
MLDYVLGLCIVIPVILGVFWVAGRISDRH